MQIEQGILNPASLTPVGTGVNAAHSAIVYIGGVAQKCVVKQIPDSALAAECFCSLLANALGLPVLQPILVTHPADGSRWFGGRFLSHPNLATHFANGITPQAVQWVAKIVSSWPKAGDAIAFDQLVLNADRNMGNLLWDGAQMTLIDHERTLGLFPMTENVLAKLLCLGLPSVALATISADACAAAAQQQSASAPGGAVVPAVVAQFSNVDSAISSNVARFATAIWANSPSLPQDTATAMTPIFYGASP